MPVQGAETHDDVLSAMSKPAVAVKALYAARSSALIAQAAQPQPTGRPLREPSLAQAIGRAGKQGIVERSVEAYTEVLIQCQQNRSPILTVPFQRSDSQQAHCYRF